MFNEVPGEENRVFVMGGGSFTLNLTCNASGSPTPTIAWFQNELPVNPMFVNDTTGSLMVSDTMGEGEFASENGVPYYCTATNRFGTIRSPTVMAFYSRKSDCV